MVRFAAAGILLAISACVPADDQLAISGQICQYYGLSQGTNAYAECVQREVHADSARTKAAWGAMSAKAAWDARQRRQARAIGR